MNAVSDRNRRHVIEIVRFANMLMSLLVQFLTFIEPGRLTRDGTTRDTHFGVEARSAIEAAADTDFELTDEDDLGQSEPQGKGGGAGSRPWCRLPGGGVWCDTSPGGVSDGRYGWRTCAGVVSSRLLAGRFVSNECPTEAGS